MVLRLHLAYSDGTQFWLDRKGAAIWAAWSERSSLENAISYLLGPVLGLLLRLRGIVCLHASAVAFDDHCVAFVGSAGAGKSTTAAAFAKLGCGIVSDDIVGLVERDGIFYVLPAYPHLCLWPESVTCFTAPLTHSRDSFTIGKSASSLSAKMARASRNALFRYVRSTSWVHGGRTLLRR